MGSEDNIFSLIGVKYPSAGMDICKLCSAVLYSTQSPYKTSNEYDTNFREYIRKQNYYCGICDLDYDDGLPSIELAVRHMNIHFTFTGRGRSSTTPKSEA